MSQSNLSIETTGGKRKLDPDYYFVKDVKKLRQDEEHQKRKSTQDEVRLLTKTRNIIERNFNEELALKEAEIDQLDNLLAQTQKALRLVRYAAVTKKYGNPLGNSHRSKEAVIHPAARLLLQGKRPAGISEKSSKVDSQQHGSISTQIPVVKTPQKPVAKVEPKGTHMRRKRRIIVGNVSRWIGNEQRSDAITHKWMIYVRGSAEEPDLSDVVSKIQFLIDESYEPNNLITVDSLPYHLSRRGWGEFPARIQIHFQNPLDPPVDIVHNLKLDKTHTGKQTLGAETHVDVWLHSSIKEDLDQSQVLSSFSPRVSPFKAENGLGYGSGTSPAANKIHTNKGNGVRKKDMLGKSQENCRTTLIRCKDKEGVSHLLPMTILPKNSRARNEWNPMRPLQPSISNEPTLRTSQVHSKKGAAVETVRSLLKSSVLPPGTSLLRTNHGPLATPPNTPTTQSRSATPTKVALGEKSISWDYVLRGSTSMALEEFERRILTLDASFAQDDMLPVYSLRKKLLATDASSFPDVDSFCLSLFRLFPIVTPASQTCQLYRFLLPYSSGAVDVSETETMASKELTRAKIIHKILELVKGPQLSFPRLQLLLAKYGFCFKSSDEEPAHVNHLVDFSVLSTFTVLRDDLKSGHDIKELQVDGDLVDVLALDEGASSKPEGLDCAPRNLRERCQLQDENWGALQFVQDTVAQSGVRLELEEIQPNAAFPVSQKILLTACGFFCEELLRLGHGEAFSEADSVGEIQLHHVVKGIAKSSRTAWLTNKHLGSPNC